MKKNRIISILPIDEIVKKDEIIFYEQKDFIFIPSYEVLERIMYNLGFKHISCISNLNKDLAELTCIYTDNDKNSVLIEVLPGDFRIEEKDFKMETLWLAVKKDALFYDSYTQSLYRINLSDYLKIFENRMGEVPKRIKNFLNKRRKISDMIYI